MSQNLRIQIYYVTVLHYKEQGHKCVTVNATGCGFDSHSRKNIYLN